MNNNINKIIYIMIMNDKNDKNDKNDFLFLLRIKNNIESQLSLIDVYNNIINDNIIDTYKQSDISKIVDTYSINREQYNILQKNHNILIEYINSQLLNQCEHEWEDDVIELTNEQLKPIKYCIHCQLNYNCN